MNEIFKKTGLIYNSENAKVKNVIDEVVECFKSHGADVELMTTDKLNSDITLAVVLGGDGSILKTSRYYAKYSVPIFGINSGRLGFLSQTKISGLKEAIEDIDRGNYRIEQRMMLRAIKRLSALNDIVIRGNTFTRTSRLCVNINGNPVCDYLADGLIVSTPTGSTAYTLSAGGPIIEPSLNAIVIIPICPHTMTARPLVIPSSEHLTISTADNIKLRVIADGQKNVTLQEGKEVDIACDKYKANLLLLNSEKSSFYSILREKLYWGMSWKG